MRHEAKQFPLALTDPTPEELHEREIQARWARNEAKHNEYWTDERRACVWAYGREDWPHSVANYERRKVTLWFHEEQERKDRFPYLKFRTIHEVEAEHERDYQEQRRRAEAMAVEIRAAFASGKKCPFKMAPGFEWLLTWAIELSCVPVESLEAGE